MLDQTPGEMIIALRQGKIDLALTLHGIDLLSRDFYARKLATVRSLVALPVSHRFATERQVSLSQLKGETFVRGLDDVVPEYTQKIIRFCRKYGGFRPRLGTIDQANGLVESLALAANEEVISIQPAFISHLKVPNVVMVPIADAGATWDLFIFWQRGKIASPLRSLLSELNLQQNRREVGRKRMLQTLSSLRCNSQPPALHPSPIERFQSTDGDAQKGQKYPRWL